MKKNEDYIRKDEILIGHKPIQMAIANKVMKSICKIIIYKNKENGICFGTGFFMKIFDSLGCLITNYHVIEKDKVYENIELEIWNNKKMKLEISNRYAKYFENPKDITIIEIKSTDKIYKDIEFLRYDFNYLNGYTYYKNIDVFTVQHPLGKDASCASGVIIDTNDYEFTHNIPTEEGSSGCPIILLNNNINLIQVIGIHKYGCLEEKVNGGTFIGEIINNIRYDLNLKEINKMKKENRQYYIGENINSINKKLNLGNLKNIKENSENINNILVNDIINDLGNNNNINNLRIDNRRYEEFKSVNFIISEINIDESNVNQEIRIINSYEERAETEQSILLSLLNLNEEYGNEKEIKQCEISINGKLIPFSYFYKFSKFGKNIIKYEFKDLLTKTDFLFYNCKYLVSIDLSNFKSQNVFNMHGMFLNCNSLTSINLSNFKTNNTINMQGMFQGCNLLTNLDLINFNTEKVKNMSYMFSRCRSLKNLNLSSFNTKNVEKMAFMFSGCSSLTNLDLLNFNTENVRNMEGMFNKCSSLTNLNLFSFSIHKNTKMDMMFNECKSLREENIIAIDNRIYQKLYDQSDQQKNNNLISKFFNLFK